MLHPRRYRESSAPAPSFRRPLCCVLAVVACLCGAPTALVAAPPVHAPPAAHVAPSAMDEALAAAVRAGDVDALRMALASGVDVDARDARGSTLLILATYYGHEALVDVLLEAGASPNAADAARGNTALMGAIFRGEDAVAHRLLADPRIDPDQRNHAGQTAAMFAALFGRTGMVAALAERGADFSVADAQGETAETLARKQGNEALADKLARHAGRAPPGSKPPP